MCFFSKKTNYSVEMREYLKDFMLQYIKDFPRSSDDVIPIFSNVNELIKHSSERELKKAMTIKKVNVECAALNYIQNFAMTEMKPKRATAFLNDENHVLDLFDYVNDLKYKKGYISKQQFDDNHMAAFKLSVESPLGRWL